MIAQPDDNNRPPDSRIAYLIAGYIRRTLTEKEHDELDAWVEASDANMLLFEKLTDEKDLSGGLQWMDGLQTEKELARVKAGLQFSEPRKRPAYTEIIFAAAACLLVVFAAWFLWRPETRRDTAAILPAPQKIILRTGTNSVDLSALADGAIAGTGALKKGDTLRYAPQSSVGNTEQLLSVSRGGQFSVILPDGTIVSLNAASTLRYPSDFGSSTREVALTGEAYFEVAKDRDRPFRVLLEDGTRVEVTGTRFNVKYYQGKIAKEVALIEGSVTVSRQSQSVNLVAGQAASVKKDTLSKRTLKDTVAVTGWREGLFVFEDAKVQDIFAEISRWYDVEVVYSAEVDELFTATVARTEPLDRLLSLLEMTGRIRFTTDKNKVYVHR